MTKFPLSILALLISILIVAACFFGGYVPGANLLVLAVMSPASSLWLRARRELGIQCFVEKRRRSQGSPRAINIILAELKQQDYLAYYDTRLTSVRADHNLYSRRQTWPLYGSTHNNSTDRRIGRS
jgi:hypothetical protein